MKIIFEGREWEFAADKLSYQQAMTVQLHTGMSIGEWEDSLDVAENPDGSMQNPPPEWLKSLGCVYWLMKAQNDVKCPIAEIDFSLAGFLTAFAEATQAELARQKAEKAAKAAEPDPTQAAPCLPAAPASSAPVFPTATTPHHSHADRPVPAIAY